MSQTMNHASASGSYKAILGLLAKEGKILVMLWGGDRYAQTRSLNRSWECRIEFTVLIQNHQMEFSSRARIRVLGFLIQSSLQLRVSPIVKYTALPLFAERFYPSLRRKTRFLQDNDSVNWLLRPLRESNLQLFALISLWISSKIHVTCPLSVKSLKSLGDEFIREQHFTTRDFLEAEIIFMQVLDFEIGASNVTLIFLEELLIQFRELARLGELVNFDACMDIMDLLYEKEETSILYTSPRSLAASVLIASYIISVPKQQLEFPLLPWVKFITSYREEDILEIVRAILEHVLKPP